MQRRPVALGVGQVGVNLRVLEQCPDVLDVLNGGAGEVQRRAAVRVADVYEVCAVGGACTRTRRHSPAGP